MCRRQRCFPDVKDYRADIRNRKLLFPGVQLTFPNFGIGKRELPMLYAAWTQLSLTNARWSTASVDWQAGNKISESTIRRTHRVRDSRALFDQPALILADEPQGISTREAVEVWRSCAANRDAELRSSV